MELATHAETLLPKIVDDTRELAVLENITREDEHGLVEEKVVDEEQKHFQACSPYHDPLTTRRQQNEDHHHWEG